MTTAMQQPKRNKHHNSVKKTDCMTTATGNRLHADVFTFAVMLIALGCACVSDGALLCVMLTALADTGAAAECLSIASLCLAASACCDGEAKGAGAVEAANTAGNALDSLTA